MIDAPDSSLTEYARFQNQAKLSITVQGGQFAIILNNVFSLTFSALGINFIVLDVEAGFQVAAAYKIDLSGSCTMLCVVFKSLVGLFVSF